MSDEAVQSNDEQQASKRDREARLRQLFAEAQEKVASSQFAAAAQRLRMIPPKYRTPDVERLNDIVQQRVDEIAKLRAEIQRDVEKDKWKKVGPKLDRLLELQPGDPRTNQLRHELEEREWQASHPRPPGDQPVPLPDPDAPVEAVVVPDDSPAPAATVVEPIVEDDVEQDDYADYVPDPAAPPPRVPAIVADDETPAAKDEADEQLEEIWEYGDRLEKSPPPLPRGRAPIYDDEEEPDDDIDLVPVQKDSTGIWIAVMVSSLVVLVAVVTTIVVLAQTTK